MIYVFAAKLPSRVEKLLFIILNVLSKKLHQRKLSLGNPNYSRIAYMIKSMFLSTMISILQMFELLAGCFLEVKFIICI